FRSMGGSIGVAVFGALFNNALAGRLDGLTVEVGEASTFTTESLRALPAAAMREVVDAFSGSLTSVFAWATPLIVLGFVLTTLLRETPLRRSTEAVDHARAMAAGSAPGTAEPEVSETFR